MSNYLIRIIVGTAIAALAYGISRFVIRRIFGDESEPLKNSRWEYFLIQIGEVILAVATMLIVFFVYSVIRKFQ